MIRRGRVFFVLVRLFGSSDVLRIKINFSLPESSVATEAFALFLLPHPHKMVKPRCSFPLRRSPMPVNDTEKDRPEDILARNQLGKPLPCVTEAGMVPFHSAIPYHQHRVPLVTIPPANLSPSPHIHLQPNSLPVHLLPWSKFSQK